MTYDSHVTPAPLLLLTNIYNTIPPWLLLTNIYNTKPPLLLLINIYNIPVIFRALSIPQGGVIVFILFIDPHIFKVFLPSDYRLWRWPLYWINPGPKNTARLVMGRAMSVIFINWSMLIELARGPSRSLEIASNAANIIGPRARRRSSTAHHDNPVR